MVLTMVLIGIHDAFELYGRPRMYNWDPRDPRSMMFAYPIGPRKDVSVSKHKHTLPLLTAP